MIIVDILLWISVISSIIATLVSPLAIGQRVVKTVTAGEVVVRMIVAIPFIVALIIKLIS